MDVFRKENLVRVDCDTLAEMVYRLFIVDADKGQLQRIENAVKGKEYAYSNSGQWVLSARYPTNFFPFSKPRKGRVFVSDGYSGEGYQLEDERAWERFYLLVMEKIKENRMG